MFEQKLKTFKLSKMAQGALMLALQKALLEQIDIKDLLENFNFTLGPNALGEPELIVLNPPIVNMDYLDSLREEEYVSDGDE